tara:strand:+ start:175 stop:780 length:606 start_codon:yes stop_codon:yes gene_type:complete
MTIEIIDLGLIDYQEALKKQMHAVEDVLAGGQERVFFCSHPPVVTLGRASEEKDLQGWQGKTMEVSRGGRATYHGPGQVIVYPILDLSKRGSDLHRHMRILELSVIHCLDHYGIEAEGDRKDATGVWVGDKKIASIGIAAKRWVSYHGLAFNLDHDPEAFKGISPCGFQQSVMTSLEDLRGEKMAREELQALLEEELLDLL